MNIFGIPIDGGLVFLFLVAVPLLLVLTRKPKSQPPTEIKRLYANRKKGK